jgi:hypothetical protein
LMPIREEPPPQAAPVSDPIPRQEGPPPAPVTEPARIQVGAQLAHLLLKISAGAIVILVFYLAVLDWVTSAQVNNVYDWTFQRMHNTPVPPDVSGVDAASKAFQAVRTTPDTAVSADDVKKIRTVIDQLKTSGRVTGPNATRLDQCAQLVSLKSESKQEDQSAAERTKTLDECIQMLEPLRQLTVSQATDLERLRLMKEYAKDAHDHRQAFRSFWLQASQLVLLNLLLPLLTALLGYIFGSQAAR